MNIKILTSEDFLAYKDIRLELLKKEPSSFGSSFEDESQFIDQQWMSRLIKQTAYTIGMFDESLIVGICVLMLSPREKMKHGAHIYSVYVKEGYRRQGIAKKLINKATGIALDNSVEILYLSVVTTNKKAVKLYKKCGFNIYGEEPKLIKFDGKYIDQYLMYKDIG